MTLFRSFRQDDNPTDATTVWFCLRGIRIDDCPKCVRDGQFIVGGDVKKLLRRFPRDICQGNESVTQQQRDVERKLTSAI